MGAGKMKKDELNAYIKDFFEILKEIFISAHSAEQVNAELSWKNLSETSAQVIKFEWSGRDMYSVKPKIFEFKSAEFRKIAENFLLKLSSSETDLMKKYLRALIHEDFDLLFFTNTLKQIRDLVLNEKCNADLIFFTKQTKRDKPAEIIIRSTNNITQSRKEFSYRFNNQQQSDMTYDYIKHLYNNYKHDIFDDYLEAVAGPSFSAFFLQKTVKKKSVLKK